MDHPSSEDSSDSTAVYKEILDSTRTKGRPPKSKAIDSGATNSITTSIPENVIIVSELTKRKRGRPKVVVEVMPPEQIIVPTLTTSAATSSAEPAPTDANPPAVPRTRTNWLKGEPKERLQAALTAVFAEEDARSLIQISEDFNIPRTVLNRYYMEIKASGGDINAVVMRCRGRKIPEGFQYKPRPSRAYTKPPPAAASNNRGDLNGEFADHEAADEQPRSKTRTNYQIGEAKDRLDAALALILEDDRRMEEERQQELWEQQSRGTIILPTDDSTEEPKKPKKILRNVSFDKVARQYELPETVLRRYYDRTVAAHKQGYC